MLRIGQVLKSDGKDGGLVVSFPEIDPEEIDLQEPVFIEFDGLPVPFYIESFTRRGQNRALVHLTGIHSLEDAEEVAGAALWADYFEEEEEEDLIGWKVVDENGTPVGAVADYEEIPGNTCLWVTLPDGKEVLLPFHEDLVLGLEGGVLRLRIPEGLL